MIQIAQHGNNGKPVSLNLIAKKTNISRRYLEQVVMPLRSANLIKGLSGKDGGYVLAKPAREILVGDIVQAAIGEINIVNCVNEPGTCTRAEGCSCRALYSHINDRILDAMNEVTLADLASPEWTKKVIEK
jgi:Rrf2 family protein